jgi:hypothetical protein
VRKKRFPHTEVLLPNGERFSTDMPVTFGIKRTIIQQFLPAGLKGSNIFFGFSPDELERAQRFDVKKAIEEAIKARVEVGLYK